MERINIFLSSPGDTKQERQIAVEQIQHLAKLRHYAEHFVFSTFAYENAVPPEIGDAPQRTVDRYMKASEADIVVCMLRQRMGTPTVDAETGERFQSGTEYELLTAWRAQQRSGRPRILLYRLQPRTSVEVDRDQDLKVDAFFARFKGPHAEISGLWKLIRSRQAFRREFFYDMDAVLSQWWTSARQGAGREDQIDEHASERPALPVNYVERAEVLSRLRATLLDPSRHQPMAIHAMGGAGKSIIAKALCNDDDVQRAFPGGVFWLELGQAPDVAAVFGRLLQDLGGAAATQESRKDQEIARLLGRRQCLLVIDNVWQRTHIESLLMVMARDSPRARILLTTRFADIARDLRATIHALPLMTQGEAVALLNEWSENSIQKAPLREQIVDRLGRLPLAVKLAGAQLRGKDAAHWLSTFAPGTLVSRRPEHVSDSFPATLELSLAALAGEVRRLYANLAIFRSAESIPLRAIQRLWGTANGLTEQDTGRLLDDLESDALVEIEGSTNTSCFVRLHDLVRDLLWGELGEARRIRGHQELLASCRHLWGGTSHGPLSRTTDICTSIWCITCTKLARSSRYARCSRTQDGCRRGSGRRRNQDDGYLADLDVAWSDAAAHAPDNEERLADCVRYALIRSSVHSIAANYIPAIVARAVETGLWPAERALTVARRVASAEARAAMFIALLKDGHTDD